VGKPVHRAFIEELPSPYGSRKIWTRALCEETHRVVETDNDFPAHEIRYTAVPADPIDRVLWYLDRDSCNAEHVL
jgi:hypothetical protein